MIQSYQDALELSQTRKRKLTHNTYLECNSDGSFGVRLHSTQVVVFHPDGRRVLDSGGWLTVTTKDRMNQCLRSYSDPQSFTIYSEKGIWYVATGNYSAGTDTRWAYEDGFTLHSDGSVTGEGKDPKAKLRLKKQLRRYAKEFMDEFASGNVPAPSGGDCWGCSMKATDGSYPMGSDGSHLTSHLSSEERYYVPTLLSRAAKRFGVSQVAQHALAVAWNPDAKEQGFDPSNPFGDGFGDIARQQLEKALFRLLKEMSGMSA